jgi:glycosyltransferase involved in cell wall biosynthesis
MGLYTDKPTILYLGEPFRRLHEAMPDNIWAAPYSRLRLRKIKRLLRDYQRNYTHRLKIKKEVEAARSYDRILVNSLFSRESLLRAYGVDSRVSYPGIDTGKFSPGAVQKEPYVVGLGTIGRIKGVDFAIEVIARIPQEIRPPLRWIANGVESGYYEEICKLSAERQVDFQPCLNISEGELTENLSGAAVMLYTSILEPFGLAPLEANACGTFVVAIAEGGIRESITNNVNGALISNRNTTEFAREVERYISDLKLAREKGIQAREFVINHWDTQKTADQFIAEIEDMAITEVR